MKKLKDRWVLRCKRHILVRGGNKVGNKPTIGEEILACIDKKPTDLYTWSGFLYGQPFKTVTGHDLEAVKNELEERLKTNGDIRQYS
jgi:hypothetical protein